MTRTVVLDLDNPGDVERLYMARRRWVAIRDADPPLREAILRRCERLDAAVALPVLAALDEIHPEAVLAAYFAELVPDRPTIGSVIRHRERQ